MSERWRICENFETHSRSVIKPGENLAGQVVHEPGVFEITELVPAEQLRGAVDRLDDAIKAARLFNRSGMTWMEYDRKLAQLETFVNDQRGR